MKNNSYKLLIFDDQYSVVSDESHTQLNKAALMVDSLMREISSKVAHVDEKRIAVLVALQMASKVLALELQIEHTSEYHQTLVDRIEHECIALLRRS
jgi:cell division protein ZapA (FtsZ GTPase activity inhibitor)